VYPLGWAMIIDHANGRSENHFVFLVRGKAVASLLRTESNILIVEGIGNIYLQLQFLNTNWNANILTRDA
jgi:hypothetical protein